ncbi:MAG: hypothetical protein F4X02_11260 [Chloroflexi bacterium]|nr:hypothetical protein [Chloroflexota bacterium]
MKRIQWLILLVISALLLIPAAQGQDDGSIITPADPGMVNPQVNITFPPAVYVVSGSVDVRGTVALPELSNFFIEFRPLALDADAGDEETDRQWFPATLPRITAVTDDILGTWNTITQLDGLYELRLAVNPNSETPTYFRVSPIRIENNPPSFVAAEQAAMVDEPMTEEEPVAEEAAEEAVSETEPEATEPEATATHDPRPRVTALVNSNVRNGDSILYTIIGGLREGESALIKGLSSYNTGWFYIELPSGRSGFIHPNIVRAEGDLTNLARINPPPLPPTPIPVPTAVPVAPAAPSNGANLIMRDIVIDPHPATCRVGYSIHVTVANIGNGAALSGGIIRVTDLVQGEPQRERTNIGFGPLAAGGSQRINGFLTPQVHVDRLHNINFELDYGNQIIETNENDNLHAEAPYILQKGNC